MTDKTKERGEKRGVLSTDRARKLKKTKDAEAADNDSTDDSGG